jgi:hypothetical protein
VFIFSHVSNKVHPMHGKTPTVQPMQCLQQTNSTNPKEPS